MSDIPRGPRSRRLGLPLLGFAVLVALVIAPGRAFAHASLAGSTPAANASVSAPAAIELRFTKPFAVVSPGIQLLSQDGAPVPSKLVISGVNATLTPESPLAPGSYGVKWAVQAPDSHPRSGAFSFKVLAAGSEPMAASPEPTVAGSRLSRALSTPSAAPYSLLASFGRIVVYTGVVLVIGALALAYFVTRASAREAKWAVLCARRASLLIGLGAVLMLFAQAGLLAGPGIPWPWRFSAWMDTLGSVWGLSWLCLMAATALFVRAPGPQFVPTDTWLADGGEASGRRTGGTAVAVPRPHPYVAGGLDARGGLPLFGAVGVLLFGLALNGHSQSSSPLLLAWLADMIHVLAAGVWGGGIVVLLAIIARRRSANSPGLITDAVLRFSIVAAAASLVAGFSGLVLTVVELPSVGALFTSTFGRILLAKIAVVIGIAAIGAYHHFVLLPRLQAEPGQARAGTTWRTLRYEALGVAAVVALSGFLAGANL